MDINQAIESARGDIRRWKRNFYILHVEGHGFITQTEDADAQFFASRLGVPVRHVGTLIYHGPKMPATYVALEVLR